MRHSNPEKRSVLGVLLISLGAILLLKNFDIIPSFISRIVFSWQFFIMLAGAFFYYGKQSKATGSMMMLVGAVFMFLKLFHYF